MKKDNEKYCSECASLINIKAEICPKCGVRQQANQSEVANPHTNAGKSWVVALMLCLFLGVFGIHRFYTRHTFIGVIQLFTLGGLFIWAFIDFILILVNAYKDADGNPLT